MIKIPKHIGIMMIPLLIITAGCGAGKGTINMMADDPGLMWE